MHFSRLGKLPVKAVSRLLLSTTMYLFASATSWADAAVSNLHSGRVTFDDALMLLSAVGLMVFVARHRKTGGRHRERDQ